MAWRESFSENEWDTLRRAPYGVFFVVAGADRKIDKKEVAEFFDNLLSLGKTLPNGLAQEVMESFVQSMNTEFLQVLSRQFAEGLRVNFVLSERFGVLPEPETFEPSVDVHDDPPYERRHPGRQSLAQSGHGWSGWFKCSGCKRCTETNPIPYHPRGRHA